MLTTTIDVIKSIVAADPTLTAEGRRTFVKLARDFGDGSGFKSPAKGEEAAERHSMLRYREAARRLGGCSVSTVRRLRLSGVLEGVRLSGKRCMGVTEESLNNLINNSAALSQAIKKPFADKVGEEGEPCVA